MRMIFGALGLLGLLVVLALTGLSARTQLQSVGARVPLPEAGAASLPGASDVSTASPRQLPQKVQDDLNKIMRQAPARLEPAQ